MKEYITYSILAVSLFINIVFLVYADTAEDKIYKQELDLKECRYNYDILNSQITQGLCLPLLKDM